MIQIQQTFGKIPDIRFIIVCGGTISGLGKGITTSSIALILKQAGQHVSVLKIDPYLNIDAGLMSPFEHGECYVLDDGGEVDLDLGNYERFLNINLTKKHNVTTGKIYQKVIEQERQGLYLGKTVQVIPHITDCILSWIEEVATIPVDADNKKPQYLLIEIGGTVGDIESECYYEAVRQLNMIYGPQRCFLVFVSYIPEVNTEQKTKPTQNGLKELRQLGLIPDIIVCRTQNSLTKSAINKVSLFSGLQPQHIISNEDVKDLMAAPLMLYTQNIIQLINEKFKTTLHANMQMWHNYLDLKYELTLTNPIMIAIVGKYTQFQDAYLSLNKALQHAAFESDLNLQIKWLESSDLEAIPQEEASSPLLKKQKQALEILKSAKGILIPGGYGIRGTEGKIFAANYARVNKIPFLGLCYGFQVACIEFARNVLNIKNATSEEWSDTYLKDNSILLDKNREIDNENIIIKFIPTDQIKLGGTMKVGGQYTIIKNKECLAYKLYGSDIIYQRHRHRFEFNPYHKEKFEEKGMIFSGVAQELDKYSQQLLEQQQEKKNQPDEKNEIKIEPRQTILELNDHPFYFATQFHPEFKSRIIDPSPAFVGFLLASSNKLDQRIQEDSGLKIRNMWIQRKKNKNNLLGQNSSNNSDLADFNDVQRKLSDLLEKNKANFNQNDQK